MNSVLLKKLNRIATRVRKGMERFAPTVNEKVNGDMQDLNCYCAIASHALMTALKKAGIPAKLVVGYFDEDEEWDYNDESDNQLDANHCWVEIEGHYMDITATQFAQYSEEKVVILAKEDADLYYPYTFPKTIKNMQGKKRDSWGNQAPRVEYTKQILALAQV